MYTMVESALLTLEEKADPSKKTRDRINANSKFFTTLPSYNTVLRHLLWIVSLLCTRASMWYEYKKREKRKLCYFRFC